MAALFLPPAEAPEWGAVRRLLSSVADLIADGDCRQLSSELLHEAAECVCREEGIDAPKAVRWVADHAALLIAMVYLRTPWADQDLVHLIVDHCGEQLGPDLQARIASTGATDARPPQAHRGGGGVTFRPR